MAIELRPVVAHRSVKIKQAFPHKLTDQDRDQAFGTREDDARCVVLPWPVGPDRAPLIGGRARRHAFRIRARTTAAGSRARSAATRSVAIRNSIAAPEIGDDFAVEAYVKCPAVPMRRSEHLRECLTERFEPGSDRTFHSMIRELHDTDQKPCRTPLSSRQRFE